jgi:hypothetical protein
MTMEYRAEHLVDPTATRETSALDGSPANDGIA